MVQFLPLPAIQFPQNAMINFQPMNQALQFYAQNQLDRGRFGLQQNADVREQEMHPLRMDRERATTAGLLGQERRADEMHPLDMRYRTAQTGLVGAQTGQANASAGLTGLQAQLARQVMPYQVLQQYWAAQRPQDQNELIYGMLGMQPPSSAAPVPQAPWPTQAAGPRPPQPISRAQLPAAGMPTGQSVDPNATTWAPNAGVTVQPQQSAPAAPPVAPAQQPAPGSWQANPAQAAIAAGLATGRLTPQAAQMLAGGPTWMGVPDALRTQAATNAAAAATAAQQQQSVVSNVDNMLALAPSAYVGAGAAARTQAANFLRSIGMSSEWMLNNRDLSATQLLQQGLAQFVGTEAEKYKPISNSDIAFIESTVANPSMSREALMGALQAARRVAARQSIYEQARAQLLMADPNATARLPALTAQVAQLNDEQLLQAVPSRRPSPSGGPQPGGVPQSTSGGTDRWRSLPGAAQAAAVQALGDGNDANLRRMFAERYGNDVLREVMRQIRRGQPGPQTIGGN